MSFEAYLFVCRQKKLPPDFQLLLRAFLRLHALHHAIFENPRVRALLPLLLAKQLAAVLAGDSSTLPAILQDHLTDPAALFAANACCAKLCGAIAGALTAEFSLTAGGVTVAGGA